MMNEMKFWSVTLALVVLVAGGCAVAPRVTIEPAPERLAAEVRADRAACAEAVGGGTREAVRDREYAACLLARGHRVTMPFRAGTEHARLTLSSPPARAATIVAADLAGCEKATQAERVSTADVVAGQIGGVRPSDSMQVRPHAAESSTLEKDLMTCLAQRGYDVVR